SELPGLNRTVQDLQIHGFPVPGRPRNDLVREVAHWLRIETAEAEARLLAGQDSVDDLCRELAGRHLLSEVLIRNRKSVVGGFMPRHAVRWKVKLTAEERRVLDLVEEYVRNGFALAEESSDQAYGFLMTTFQKLMASSNRALRTSLNRRRERLLTLVDAPKLTKSAKALVEQVEDGLDDDRFVADLLAEISSAHEREAETLQTLVDELDSLTADSKADKLVKKMAKLRQEEPEAKVLIFTEFRETQNYVSERLASAGWAVELFHGQLKPGEKDAAVERFQSATGPTVLVSTEAGGEGRNFQFCHFLVNYDLPWNPMRVEQRIGRLDRIGQEHVVNVFNLSTKGTVEERVLDVLERRIHLFEETVGGLDPILGDAEKNLTKILKLSGEKREAALAKFEERMERDVRAAREADEKLRDLIMEVRSFDSAEAAELLERRVAMSPETHRRLMIRMLAEEKTHLTEHPDGTMVVKFNNEFRAEYPEIADGPYRERHISFRADLHADSEQIEYFTLGHPVADAMLARVTDGEYWGNAGSITIASVDTVPEGEGWLVVHQLSVPGPREIEALVASWVDESGIDQHRGQALLEHLTTVPSAGELTVDIADLPSLQEAIEVAGVGAQAQLSELSLVVGRSRAGKAEKDLLKLSEYFDVRVEAASQKLAHATAVLDRLRVDPDEQRQTIVPVWESNVERAQQLVADLGEERARRLAALEKQVFTTGTVEVVAIGRIRVVAPADAETAGDPGPVSQDPQAC
ncbi:MAG: hypothetical protein LC118_15085, partial [Dehalococcoidia bacterium]|nr:hypothetical protein [Dehalococcoidia bacterium]